MPSWEMASWRHDARGQVIERDELVAPADFPAHFAHAEVFWLAFEQCEDRESVGCLQQGVQGGAIHGGQLCLENGRQAMLFCSQGLTDDVLLEHGIARADDALLGEIPEHLAQDVDGFATDPGGLLRAESQMLAVPGCAEAILKALQHAMPLFEDGSVY